MRLAAAIMLRDRKGKAVKTIVLATNNVHKVSEIEGALAMDGWEFKTLRQLGVVSDP